MIRAYTGVLGKGMAYSVPSSRRFSVAVPLDIFLAIERLAAAECRSRDQMARVLVMEALRSRGACHATEERGARSAP